MHFGDTKLISTISFVNGMMWSLLTGIEILQICDGCSGIVDVHSKTNSVETFNSVFGTY